MVGIQNLISEDLFEQLNSDEYYINTQVKEYVQICSGEDEGEGGKGEEREKKRRGRRRGEEEGEEMPNICIRGEMKERGDGRRIE